MNIFKRNWFLIILLIPFFLISLNCGSGTGETFSYTPEEYTEFQEWIESYPTDPKLFVAEWNKRETWREGWKYDAWEVLSWKQHKDDSAFEVWKLKYTNCYRMATIVLYRCSGGKRLNFMQANGVQHSIVEYTGPSGKYWISYNNYTGSVFEEWPEWWGVYDLQNFEEYKID